MKERPILFSAPMVRAILSGRKTQTRRIVKPQPHAGVRRSVFVRSGLEDGHGRELRCPHGAPGTRLWVREQFSYSYGTGVEDRSPCWYWADGQPDYGDWARPAPSIRMPRWASRITLEVTGVRVERLQEISYADAMAEGVEFGNITDPLTGEIDRDATEAFEVLWESIHGSGSWDMNPYVWVIEFRRVS